MNLCIASIIFSRRDLADFAAYTADQVFLRWLPIARFKLPQSKTAAAQFVHHWILKFLSSCACSRLAEVSPLVLVINSKLGVPICDWADFMTKYPLSGFPLNNRVWKRVQDEAESLRPDIIAFNTSWPAEADSMCDRVLAGKNPHSHNQD